MDRQRKYPFSIPLHFFLIIIMTDILQPGSVFAQFGGEGPPIPLFEERAPEIGEPLPDISIFDEAGKPVDIRQLARENYTVLVLGCLT